MKKLILISIIVLLAACSSSNNEQEQDYTSFVFWHDNDMTLVSSVVGYYTVDGMCHKVAELGDLVKDIYSPEIILTNEEITELYFFCDNYGGIRLKQSFKLQSNRRNVFYLEDKGSDSINPNDPMQYPQ